MIAAEAGKGSAADWLSTDATGVASGAGSAAFAGAKHIPGVQQGVDLVNNIDSVGKALGFLFSARGLEVIGGGLLVLIGLVGLMREVGVNVPGPVGAAAGVIPVVGPTVARTTSAGDTFTREPGNEGRHNEALAAAHEEGVRQGEVANARKAGRQSAAMASPRARTVSSESHHEKAQRIRAKADLIQ